MNELTTPALLAALQQAKLEADNANKRFNELEAQVAERIGFEHGTSKTHNLDHYKVLIKAPINYRLDVKAWETVKEQVPENMRPVVMVPKLERKGLTYLRNNEPETYAIVAKAVSSSNGKVSVTVTEMEGE